MNQKHVLSKLEGYGLNYHVAANKSEVLEKIDTLAFDLVLMDIFLPDTDGYLLTEIIREKENNPNQHVPIIALSASTLNEDIEQACSIGMNGYLTKPFSSEQLNCVLEDTLKKKKQDPKTVQQSEGGASEIFKYTSNEDKAYKLHMFSLFKVTMPTEIERLKSLLKERNAESLGKLAHKIKPSFTLVGFPELTKKLQIIEKTIKTGAGFKAFENMVVDFLSEFDSFVSMLDIEIGKLKSEKSVS